MVDIVRTVAISGGFAGLVAWSIMAPGSMRAVLADEPAKAAAATITEIFPKPFDPDDLARFDITTGPGISTDVQRSASVSKISYGHRQYVSIVTTPSGTYSTDALASPNVRYPGIDVVSKAGPEVGYGSFDAPYGSGTWSSYTRGSITYFTYSFTPAAHS